MRGIAGEASGLVAEVFRLLRGRRVPLLMLENVRNMLILNKGEAMRYLVDEVEALGYRWAYRLVDRPAVRARTAVAHCCLRRPWDDACSGSFALASSRAVSAPVRHRRSCGGDAALGASNRRLLRSHAAGFAPIRRPIPRRRRRTRHRHGAEARLAGNRRPKFLLWTAARRSGAARSRWRRGQAEAGCPRRWGRRERTKRLSARHSGGSQKSKMSPLLTSGPGYRVPRTLGGVAKPMTVTVTPKRAIRCMKSSR